MGYTHALWCLSRVASAERLPTQSRIVVVVVIYLFVHWIRFTFFACVSVDEEWLRCVGRETQFVSLRTRQVPLLLPPHSTALSAQSGRVRTTANNVR